MERRSESRNAISECIGLENSNNSELERAACMVRHWRMDNDELIQFLRIANIEIEYPIVSKNTSEPTTTHVVLLSWRYSSLTHTDSVV